MNPHRREAAVVVAIAVLAAVLAVAAPGYFARGNLMDLFLANMPVLIVAIGTTLVILVGEIDISVGSVFAISAVSAGIVAKSTESVAAAIVCACAAGATLGAVSGALVAFLGIPSIVVTLAAMVALRDALRWATQGAWIEDLPARFQWLGLSQAQYPVAAGTVTALLVIGCALTLGYVSIGRMVYATGSNQEAARLAGINTRTIKFVVFVLAGALTGLAAVLNSMRFNQIPTNTGLGLEMKVIAAVVVGGAAISGGRGTIAGTLFGTILLGAIGPALTFLGVTAYWERALQGAIILVAVGVDGWRALRAGRIGRPRATQTADAAL
jgi:ribose/xylose/arabinose/galactoside ABC-type transport system permease subunit